MVKEAWVENKIDRDGNALPLHIIFRQLQDEIHRNEKLMLYMMNNVEDAMDFAERLGVIAAYFNLEMDGNYVPVQIAEILLNLVRKENEIVIYAPTSDKIN